MNQKGDEHAVILTAAREREISPEPGVSRDPQQSGQPAQAVQTLSRDEWSVVAATQQVPPDMLVLQIVENLLDLEDGAQTPPLRLHLGHLLFLHHLLLGFQ